jgi:hypothetical protein
MLYRLALALAEMVEARNYQDDPASMELDDHVCADFAEQK